MVVILSSKEAVGGTQMQMSSFLEAQVGMARLGGFCFLQHYLEHDVYTAYAVFIESRRIPSS